ncbi:MAG TPA: heme exporter protein CcmB [Thermoanaerobaculia bacterium]|nr:heme exporter protein CcmB [Thermoanaerobaculia bacterium]
MSRAVLSWWSEAIAVFAKDWRSEFRTRYALNTVALFALTTLVLVSLGLGPLGSQGAERATVLPTLLWLILLFASSAGLPRSFVHEEESGTAVALRLAATPSAIFVGKALFSLSLLLAIEALVAPLYLALVQLTVARPGLFVIVLVLGGWGVSLGSTLIAAIISQARGKGALFTVLAFPLLLPLFLLAIELTRTAIVGDPTGPALAQLALYDGALTVGPLMLFPSVWLPGA